MKYKANNVILSYDYILGTNKNLLNFRTTTSHFH